MDECIGRSDRSERGSESAAGGELQRSFLSGTLVLTAATVVSKVIGLFYRIPLLHAVGIGGMAYFLAANHIYVTLYLIASAGLPLAVSILVSERAAHGDGAGASRVFRSALTLFLLFGGAGSLFLALGAPWIARHIGLAGATLSLRAVAPTLLFSSVSAAIRGEFQGYRKMGPTAVSEVIESVSKLVFGLGLARFAVAEGYDKTVTAAFASAGLLIGTLLSTAYLAVRRARSLPERERLLATVPTNRSTERSVRRTILKIAAPVTCSSLVLSVASVVDTVLISRRLIDAGFAPHDAEAMYSSYGNLALPLFSLPASLITPVSLALVPLLSSAFRSGDRAAEQTVIASAMRLSALLAIPASMGLSVFAEPILSLLYPKESAAVTLAAPLLAILALSVLFSCFMTVTNSILSTYGHPACALLSMSVGAAIKIAFEYVLVGTPAVNVYGAPISTFLCNLTVTAMNLAFVYRYGHGCEPIASVFGRPFLASLPAIFGAGLVYALLLSRGGPAFWKVPIALFAAVLIYALAAVRTKALREEDVLALPAGKRLRRLLFPEQKPLRAPTVTQTVTPWRDRRVHKIKR